MSDAPVLLGARVRLSPFGAERISERYLSWLSDPEVNEYSRRRDMPAATREDAVGYLMQLQTDEHVLAIDVTELGHIGNVKYGPIDHTNKRCDVAIMLGERSAWGHGYGTEAVYLVSRWLFEVAGVDRVDAGTANPAFLRLVEKLGWAVEGVQREKIRIGSEFLDWTVVALLARHFSRRADLEAVEQEFVVS